jgi:predicted RNase H-like HicB family nuclease
VPNQRRLTAIIEREDEVFVALCPELDVASEGKTIEEARANLVEVVGRFHDEIFIT